MHWPWATQTGDNMGLSSFSVSAAGKLPNRCVTALSSRTLVNSSVLLIAGRKMEFSCFPAVCQPDRPVRRDFSSSLSSLASAMSPQSSSIKHKMSFLPDLLAFLCVPLWPLSTKLYSRTCHRCTIKIVWYIISFWFYLFFVTVLSFYFILIILWKRSLSSYFHYTI